MYAASLAGLALIIGLLAVAAIGLGLLTRAGRDRVVEVGEEEGVGHENHSESLPKTPLLPLAATAAGRDSSRASANWRRPAPATSKGTRENLA